MKTVIYINNEGISFERNWFTGSFTYTKDGITKNLDSLLKSDVEVEGEIEYEFYNGNIVRKYKIKNI